MSSLAIRALMMVIVSLAWLAPAAAENKLAFVVGINSYPNFGPDAQLQRALADADTVAQALKSIDFKVTSVVKESDTKEDQLLGRLSRFLQDIQPGDTVLVYYSGYGVGLGGSNLLLPSDTPDMKGADEYVLKSHAISEADIVARIKARGARVTILVIDACRNSPFGAETQRTLSLAKGLQPIDLSEGTMSIYAAGFGQKAFDRLSDTTDTSPNSVFARVFAAELKRPKTNLLEFAENIRERVATLARSANLVQIPTVNNELLGARTIFLAGEGPDAAPTPPVRVIAPETPPGPVPGMNASSEGQIGGAIPPDPSNPPIPGAPVKASDPPGAVVVAPPKRPVPSSEGLNRRSAPPPRREATTGPVGRAAERQTRPPPPDTVPRHAVARRLPATSGQNRRGPGGVKPADVGAPEEGSAEACDWICRSQGHVDKGHGGA